MASSHSNAKRRNATEHAKELGSSHSAAVEDVAPGGIVGFDSDDDDEAVTVDGFTKLVEATIQRHAEEETFAYTNDHLLEHKKLWDVLTRNKHGDAKEHAFSYWCRKVNKCRTTNKSKFWSEKHSNATREPERPD